MGLFCVRMFHVVVVVLMCGELVLAAHPTNKTGQAPKPPRTRLLVIRPPPGTGQPNRVLIITDPRKLPSDTASSRRDPSRTRASDPFSVGRRSQDVPKVKGHQHGGTTSGGHPQSQVRRQGGQSLRTLLDDLRNNRARNSNPRPRSNIAGAPRAVPRAASISVPTDAGFGDVNMPSAMEAALKTLREQALQLGRMRKQVQGNIRVPDRTPVMNRKLLDLLRSSMAGQTLSKAGRNSGSGRFSGSVGTVDSISSPTARNNRGNIGSNLRKQVPAANVAGSSKTSMNTAGNQSKSVKASKKRIINSDTAVISKGGVLNPVASSKLAASSNINAKNSTGTNMAVNKSLGPVGSQGGVIGVGSKGSGKGRVSINATAAVQSSAAKAERNTTETKSLKTKNIKVTTVIKGGTAADVAAAAASQAEIANAVAQGKEINSSSLAAIAAAAAAPKTTKPPVGSITVKREPNGDSVITLSDGQGEPVILRASGPIKIERIIKPNGKVQFLINPVKPPVVDLDIEPEDITTTVQTTTGGEQAYLEGSTTPSIFASPTFIPSMTLNPYFDLITTTEPTMSLNPLFDILTTSATTNHIPGQGETQQSSGVEEVTRKPVTNKTVQPITQTNTPAAEGHSKGQGHGLENTIGPLIPQNVGGEVSGPVVGGETQSAVTDARGVGAVHNSKIPRPPLLTDSRLGPFDMLNSVIDFNKNIPRPSVESGVGENRHSTNKPSVSNVNTLQKKVVPSTDAMPQYNLVSSSPPLKIVPKTVP